MNEPRLAPFANFFGDHDDLADACHEQDDPWDADDIAFHAWQNELFDAGYYQEDEQQIFARWSR